MTKPELIKTVTELSIEEIVISKGRLREVSTAAVEALQTVVQEVGFTTPVIVRRKADSDILIDGAHRLEALRRLGVKTVPVRLYRCTDNQAREMEASANLAGASLTPLDDAIFLAAWQKAYEKQHPETRRGAASARARSGEQTELSSFCDAVAEKRGITSRQVRKIAAVGRSLNHDQVRWLRAAKNKIKLKDLVVLSKIDDDQERSSVCIAMANGAKSASDARTQYLASVGKVPPPLDQSDADFKALQTAFDRASKKARLAFVETHQDLLEALLNEVMNG